MFPQKNHVHRNKTERRNQHGDFLVEAVVSVLISSIIGTALIQMYTQVKRVGNMSTSELLATAVASEIVDHLRGLPYTFVVANMGDHYPQVNGTVSSSDPLFPYALLKDDSGSYDYTGNGDSAMAAGANTSLLTCDPLTGAQTNNVHVNLTPMNGMTGVQIAVTLCYLDSSGKPKTYAINSVITPNGLNG